MDHEWAASQLENFVQNINSLRSLMTYGDAEDEDTIAEAVTDGILREFGNVGEITDRLVTLDPVMRDLMNAARPGLGNYTDLNSGGYSVDDSGYWQGVVRPNALQAIGIHTLGAEASKRMQPDSPDLAADQLHPWVWKAAAPMWEAGSTQEAVHAAARSVNARLQQKLRRHDTSDAGLCRDAFSTNAPADGHPRLRFPGDRTSETWRSRQQGAGQLGAGCFEGIRNPVAHDHGLNLPGQVALEQLAALSVLARWIDECTRESAPASQH